MSKNNDFIPIKTWQFFHAAREVLGVSFLQKIFKRSTRQIYKWGSDPDFTLYVENNPLDRLITVFRKLKEIGRVDIALSGLRILAENIGCDVIFKDKNIVPDKETIQEECLDDHPSLVKFHNAIREGKSIVEVERYKDELLREIQETLVKYREEKGEEKWR